MTTLCLFTWKCSVWKHRTLCTKSVKLHSVDICINTCQVIKHYTATSTTKFWDTVRLPYLMNHCHGYCHLWQTLLLLTSYSFWSTDLEYEVTRPLTNWLLLEESHEGHGLPAKMAGKRSLVANQRVRWPHKEKSSKAAYSVFRCEELCAKKVEIIRVTQLKTDSSTLINQSNITT